MYQLRCSVVHACKFTTLCLTSEAYLFLESFPAKIFHRLQHSSHSEPIFVHLAASHWSAPTLKFRKRIENFQTCLEQLKVNPAATPVFFVPWKLQVSVIGIATRLRPGRSRGRIPISERDFSRRQVLQTGSRAHRAFSPTGTRVLSRQYGGRGLKLTIHLHLVMRLKMSELHLYYPHMPSWHGQGNFTFTFTLPEKLNIQKPRVRMVMKFKN